MAGAAPETVVSLSDAPRLPDRAVAGDDVVRLRPVRELPNDPSPFGPRLPNDLPTYEPPTLLNLTLAGRVWIATSLLSAVWALALGIAAIRAKGTAAGGNPGRVVSGRDVFGVGIAGVVAAAGLSVAGAYWSDRRTRNIHRLEGHRPTRNHAVRAWLYPLMWVLLMSVTLLRLKPNPDFDIRPMIIVTGYAASVWRTFKMLRRIFLSLTRMVEDVLLASYVVLQGAGFGLIWWRLTNWPHSSAPADARSVEVLIGVSFASAGTLAVSAGLVILIVRAGKRAEQHRMLALRARHDQRLLRTLGLDPLDRSVRIALLRIRQANQVAARHQPSATELALTRDDGSVPVAPIDLLLTGAVSARINASLGMLDDHNFVETLITALRQPGETDPLVDIAPAGADLRIDQSVAERINASLGRLDDHDFAEALIASIRQQQEDDARIDGDGNHPAELRMIPPRLIPLEAIQFLLVLSNLAVVVGFGWLVVGSVDDGANANAGRLASGAIGRVNDARSVAIIALSASMVLTLLWTISVSWYAAKANVANTRTSACVVLFGAASVGTVAARVLDPTASSRITIVLLAATSVLAAAGLLLVRPVATGFGRRTAALQSLAATLPLIVAVSLAAGLDRRLAADIALGRVAFFGVGLGLLAAVITVIAWLLMLDIGDRLHAAPELATPIAPS